MKRFKPLFAASLLALALCSPGLAAVTRYKIHIYDQNGNNVNCSTGTTIASIILQPYGSAAGAVGTSNTISTITVSASGTPTTLTTSTTSATVIADNAGNIWFDLDPEVTGDCTIIFGTLTKSGITFSGSPPQVDCLREASRILSGFSSAGAVTLASSQSFNNTGQSANLPANIQQIAGQTANASASITFPASISSLTQTQVTGGSYSLQTDGSGYIKVSNGTATGQISLSSGAVALQTGQTVASVSGSVGSVTGNVGGSVASVVDKTGFSLAVAPPTAAAIRSEIDANSTQLAKLGSPSGVSLAADIAANQASLSTLTTRVPNILPAYPTNFATLAINGSGYVTATNGGGGGSTGLSNSDIAAIWAYGVPNVPTAGSVIELAKNKLTPLSFDGSNNVNAKTNVIASAAVNDIVAAMQAIPVDGSITQKQKDALTLAVLTGKSHATAINLTTHQQVVTYYRQDGTTLLATATITYDATNKMVVDRGNPVFTNLP